MKRLLLIIFLLASTLSAQNLKADKCGFAQGSAQLTQVTRAGERDIPNFDESLLDESMVSSSGVFRIHFTRNGDHAVANPNPADWPPFVLATANSADSVYSVMTNELGFLPPKADGDIDGPELDIYIRNWFGSFYGMTYFDPYINQSNYPGYPAYLVLDNDYTEANYATSGLEALKVTIAHEFFHIVQLQYAHPGEFNWENLNWFEISSTWMEEVCYPDIDDYHAYVADNFRQISFPEIDGPSAYSYGHCLFGQVLDQEYGSRDGMHVMLDIWTQLHGNKAFENLDAVLSDSRWNSSLVDALGKYALYNVFTGSRSIPGEYYHDAPDLAELRTTQFQLSGETIEPIPFELQPLQIQYKSFAVPTLTNILIRGDGISQNQRIYLSTHDLDGTNLLKGAVSNYWIPCQDVTSQDYLICALSNGDLENASAFNLEFEVGAIPLEDTIQALWPNPVSLKEDGIHLNLILSRPGPLIITLYDILGRQVYRANGENQVEGVFEMDLALPDHLTAGLYILQIRTGGQRMNRKITVFK